jgi:hypothetical protein
MKMLTKCAFAIATVLSLENSALAVGPVGAPDGGSSILLMATAIGSLALINRLRKKH